MRATFALHTDSRAGLCSLSHLPSLTTCLSPKWFKSLRLSTWAFLIPLRHLLANQCKIPLVFFGFARFPHPTSGWANFNGGHVTSEQLTSFGVTQEWFTSLQHPSALHPWSRSFAVISQISQALSGSNSVSFGISIIIFSSAKSFQRKQIHCTKERMKKNTRLLILLIYMNVNNFKDCHLVNMLFVCSFFQTWWTFWIWFYLQE